MFSLISRRRIFSVSATRGAEAKTRGLSICRRLKASSWCVSSAARCAARRISSSVLARRAVGADRLERQVAVAEDRGEQVVEVVGDAAGEAAHGLHLLRLSQLFLRRLQCELGAAPLRDVVGDDEPRAPAAVGACRRS